MIDQAQNVTYAWLEPVYLPIFSNQTFLDCIILWDSVNVYIWLYLERALCVYATGYFAKEGYLFRIPSYKFRVEQWEREHHQQTPLCYDGEN